MRTDPVEDWRRLTEHYRTLTNEQLRGLALDFADLTEIAQQILKGEMRSRGLGDPQTASAPQQRAEIAPARAPDSFLDRSEADDSLSGLDDLEPDDRPHEYTWKTLLSECEQSEQAWQLQELLRRAKIESWAEGSQAGRHRELRYPHVLVAADQLDQARAIAAGPIPQEIIDAPKETVPEFEVPHCPGCDAADPLLESVDRVNVWQCEICGKQWTDPAPAPGEEPQSQEGWANRLQKTERAARQQGSSILRENSSNGGKTVRTFWLHSRSGGWQCQGEL